MNHYMDIARADPSNLAARAKAEKYAKILAKTIISPDGDASQYGDNAYFYDSAEGLLTAVVLLLAEFVPPKDSSACWPGIKTIARELGLSPRTVQRALADLERRQLIEKRQRHRANGSLTSNLYRLTAAKKSQPPAKGGL